MTPNFLSDILAAKRALSSLPLHWDGRASVLELKAADYQWKQMEWWAFFFEHLCQRALVGVFQFPGERIGPVKFDAKRSVNWDLKSKAIKSDAHRAILNDKTAMEQSVRAHGEHGVMLALCDVEYNDHDRSFQRWHTDLKGGLSAYEHERLARTSVSRYRKTSAGLTEILFLRFDARNLALLGTMRQGRNSSGAARPEKYMIDLEAPGPFLAERLLYPSGLGTDLRVAEP